ncbi:Rieske (2Fe-2S) protein [Aspergillus mulundensis]|uniref:Rieske domain-containing protein n=1 Tax=Aspergillus mulundensis TaxID=1810919 RepID=A0A3D8SJY0_9EURO|nr:hypothetical protein DSM5745_03146 [Aspergillus mulundensis]RDW86504.1 hypothetical protein DSM5745_03146 [Aspergillus mulundensis]
MDAIQDEEGWRFVGALSSFQDLSHSHLHDGTCRVLTGCKTFRIPRPEQDKPRTSQSRSSLDEQVLVFKYKGSMHAIDNVSAVICLLYYLHFQAKLGWVMLKQRCPHSSFPLKQGTVFDIEDAGAGVKCFRHGWTFDLLSGRADRGNGSIKLAFWDIELRDLGPLKAGIAIGVDEGDSDQEDGGVADQGVWVRRQS